MFIPEIIDSHHALTREEIAQVEGAAGAAFPDDYVRFLLKHNGGKFLWCVDSDLTEKPENPREDQYAYIERFWFIGSPDDLSDADHDLREYAVSAIESLESRRGEPMPGMLKVANSDCGWIYVCCIGQHRGKVYLQTNGYGEQGLLLVAHSFDDFMRGLLFDPSVLMCDDPLFQVIEKGDDETLAMKLDADLAVETRNEAGETLLMFAAKCGTARCTRLLLDRGADIMAKDPVGETPLHKAARLGRLDVTRLLLNAGADVNARSDSGETPLLTNLKSGLWGGGRSAILLIDSGTDLTLPDHEGTTPLLEACLSGHMHISNARRRANETIMHRDPNPSASIPWIVEKVRNGYSSGCERLGELGAIQELLQLATEGNIFSYGPMIEFFSDSPEFHAVLRAQLKQRSNLEARRNGIWYLGLTHCPSSENLAALEEASHDIEPRIAELAAIGLKRIKETRE